MAPRHYSHHFGFIICCPARLDDQLLSDCGWAELFTSVSLFFILGQTRGSFHFSSPLPYQAALGCDAITQTAALPLLPKSGLFYWCLPGSDPALAGARSFSLPECVTLRVFAQVY